jgi:hypothetical protein
MNSGALNAQIEFLREIEKLKTVTRANRTLDGRSENLPSPRRLARPVTRITTD